MYAALRDMPTTKLIFLLGQMTLLSAPTVTNRCQILPLNGCPDVYPKYIYLYKQANHSIKVVE